MAWLSGALAVLLNDLRLELRTRVALGALALFVAASLVLVAVTVGRAQPTVPVVAAMLWIVIVFAVAVGLGRSFVAEEERGTSLLLTLALRPSQIYAGKLAGNVLITLAVAALAGAGVRILLPVPVGAPSVWWTALALGAVGLASASTLLSALVARARAAGPLLPVLSFPVVVPVLLPAVSMTVGASGAADGAWAAAQADVTGLVAYAGLLVSASFLLFEWVWRD